MGSFKGDLDIIVIVPVAVIIANDLQPVGKTQTITVVHHFIAHIPRIDLAFIPGYNGGDMFLHSLHQHVCGDLVSLVVIEEPIRALGVPHQGMSPHSLVVFLAKLHQLIRAVKVVNILGRMNGFGLGVVFQSKHVELLVDDIEPIGPLFQVSGVYGGTHLEIVLIHLANGRGFILIGIFRHIRGVVDFPRTRRQRGNQQGGCHYRSQQFLFLHDTPP